MRPALTYTLIVARGWEILGVFYADTEQRLMKKAQELDAATHTDEDKTPLRWAEYVSHRRALSDHDEERAYQIHPARLVT
jgi:hypothetical protein